MIGFVEGGATAAKGGSLCNISSFIMCLIFSKNWAGTRGIYIQK